MSARQEYQHVREVQVHESATIAITNKQNKKKILQKLAGRRRTCLWWGKTKEQAKTINSERRAKNSKENFIF